VQAQVQVPPQLLEQVRELQGLVSARERVLQERVPA
jgi:hypothetical protein